MLGRVACAVVAGVLGVVGWAGVAGAATLVDTPTRTLGQGAWSWFENPRAIVTGGGCEVLASAAAGPDGGPGWVNVESSYYQNSAANPTPRRTVTVDKTLTKDDHTSGALLRLANGEVLVAWSGHAQDRDIRIAVRSPGRTWTRLAGFRTSKAQTYNNLFLLSDGSIIDITRGSGPASPHVYHSTDNGRTWSHRGELVRWTGDTVDHRPYVQYVQRGDRIWFMATLGHPQLLADRGIDSPIYAGYLEGTTVFRSDGTVAGALNRGVQVNSLTLVYQPPAMYSAWTSGLTLDALGNPIAVFSVRNRNVASSSPLAVRYAQARWNGAWTVHDVGPGGRVLYGAEGHYSGNVIGDPGDPNHVVISTSVDPSTNANLGQFEIFDGRTADGVTWTWTRITTTPKKDDLRPFLTNRMSNGMQALAWFQGRYTTYTSYDTDVKYRQINPLNVACPPR